MASFQLNWWVPVTAMTFAATVVSRIGIWQVSDNRLTRNRMPLANPSIKQMILECRDGKALISYAGIGASPQDLLHVSDWMRKLLRGRDLTVESALNILAQAATVRLAKYKRFHTFLIGACVQGEPILYGITNKAFDSRVKQLVISQRFQVTCNRLNQHPKCIALTMEGTGSLVLQKYNLNVFPDGKFLMFDETVNQLYRIIERRWNKPEIRYDVMGYLAHLNRIAGKRLEATAWAGTVSEECVITFLDPRTLALETRGYGHAGPIWVPTVAGRWDVTQLTRTVLPEIMRHMSQCMDHHEQGLPPPEVDGDKMNELLRAQDWRTLDDFR